MIDSRLKRIADYYGKKRQTHQAIEELNELAVELAHSVKLGNATYNLAEEIADAENMLDQIKYLYSDNDDMFVIVEAIKNRKVERQLKRIADEEYEREVCMDG